MANKLSLFLTKNILILILFVTYIFALHGMTKFDMRSLIQSLIYTLPVVFSMTAWCCHALKNHDFRLKSYSSYHEPYTDLFFIFYALFLGGLVLIGLEQNNTDLRGWWPFALLFQSIIYLIFSFVFTSLLKIIPRHKLYTYIWFFVILFSWPVLHYLPLKTNIWLLGRIDTFYTLLFTYLIVNAIIISIWKKRGQHGTTKLKN